MNKNFQYDFHDIESYYDKAIEYINKELMDSLRLTSADNLKCWNMLKFEESNSPRNREKPVFHVDIIEENQNSFSFFVETQAPFEHFTEREIDYLRKKQNKKKIKTNITCILKNCATKLNRNLLKLKTDTV